MNNQMVLAYWQIGREIVQGMQDGQARAEYGEEVLEALSKRLTERYGRGFSVTNLRYFRLFYRVYADRSPEIRHPAGDESTSRRRMQRKHHSVGDVLVDLSSAVERTGEIRGFASNLSWRHYVRLFDEQCTTEGDNPTVGLILCAEKNEAVARYSVLHESKQLFAAKYVLYLPTVEELQRELKRERRMFEARLPGKAAKP